MDFDKTILLSNIIDARRNGDTESLSHLILRYLCSFDDGIVYVPKGVAGFLQQYTETTKRTTYRHLESLECRSIFCRFDEFSLQLNDQFSSKGTKPVLYKGSRVIYDRSEQAFVFDLETKRMEFWQLRGKNKKHIKATKEQDMIVAKMQKQFDELKKQNQEMMEILRSIASDLPNAKEKAQVHLRLIEGGKNE